MYADWTNYLAQIIPMLFAFLLVLSVHEAAHAGMAYILGDDTAKRDGRLTLNPFAHVDLLGLLCLLVFRIGWAKPVIFDHRNFKRPKLYSVLSAYAGPLSNFLLALLAFVVLRFLPMELLPLGVAVTFKNLLTVIAQVSVMLGVFNMLPIPPLDGSHVLMVLLIDRYPQVFVWLYRYSFFILLGCLLVPQFLSLLWLLIDTVYNFLHGLVF
jgi:Zn-dependent protease